MDQKLKINLGGLSAMLIVCLVRCRFVQIDVSELQEHTVLNNIY